MIKESMTALAIIAGLVATTADAREGGARMQERFTQIDADSDGQITVAEIQALAAARFAEADANKDGALSQDEMTAMHQARAEKAGKEAKEGRQGKRAEKRFNHMDADNSGTLTLEEMQGRRDPAKMVASLDADKSGGLSFEEFSKARDHGKKGKKRKAD